MALRSKDLTSQITGTNDTFSIAPAAYEPKSCVLIRNGLVQTPNTDYAENSDRHTLTTTDDPLTTDSLVVYYNDPAISALPDPFNVVTLRGDYLFGLDLKDQNGNVMSDVTLGNKLTIGVARAQRELKDFSFVPQVIKSTIVNGVKRNDGSYAVDPEPGAIAAATIFEDPYDYDINDYINWGFLTLRRKPVVSIERIRLIYPTGQTIIQYPNEWIKLYAKFGQVHIVPMAGSFNQYPLIGQGAMYLPLLSGFLTKSIPQLIHVDYTAGLTEIPDDLKDAVYKLGAVEVLKLAGQARAPGIASVSTGADGLSESTTLTQSGQAQMFGPLIKQYEDDAKAAIKLYLQTQKGIDFRVA